MKKTFLATLMIGTTLLLLTSSCQPNNSSPQQSSSPSPNDSTSQPLNNSTIQQLNNLTWLTENLNLDLPGSWCYDDIPSYCKNYGRLYPYEAAVQACKNLGPGWRLPTLEEWTALVNLYGEMGFRPEGQGPSAFDQLIKGGSSGLNIVRAGTKTINGFYADLGDQAFLWTSTPSQGYGENVYKVIILQSSSELVHAINFDAKQGASCRCVRE